MRHFYNFFFLTLFLPHCSHAQQARIYSLQKLYDPQPAAGDFIAWKNEGILIPIRFESNSLDLIEVAYSGPDAVFQLFQLHDIWADFSAGNCGQTKTNGTFNKIQVPDRAEPKPDLTIVPTNEKQWVLVFLKFPTKTDAGSFPFTITFDQEGTATEVAGNITLKDRTLKNLSDLDFYSDFWQFPISMADYYQIKPWSAKHWEYVGEMFELLQSINQHSITTTVFWDLYNTRIRTMDEMMIKVKKSRSGDFSYDYSVFDKYVELAHAKGISGQIAVHNLFPWNGFLFYFDETTSAVRSVQTQPGTEEYQSFWGPFLIDFSEHLRKNGWLDKTVLFIDERDPAVTLDLAKWVKHISPDFKMGFSGDFYPFLSEWIEDYSMPMNVVMDAGEIRKRTQASKRTSLYTSCFEKPNQPNLLLTNDYRDIYFLTLLSKAKGYDGMLRWAFNLWSADIMHSAIYSDLPSGDAHLIYPKGQVSVRYLVLKDALEELGKLEMQAEVQHTIELLHATNRYFLINIEGERYQMLQAMKNYLND